MKYLILFFLFGLLGTPQIFAQKSIDREFREKTVQKLESVINDNYVFPDIAKKTGEHLRARLQSGYFDKFDDLDAFASSLTTEVQSINKDKHMRIRPAPTRNAPEFNPNSLFEDQLENYRHQREELAGFREVKKFDGNVGYLDIRFFADVAAGGPVADTYMKLLSGSDAIIVDMRYNGGGSPAMVQYLCSYFFDKPVHLNSLYWRKGNITNEFWTLDKLNGSRLPDVPLFVLTSTRTFSGAEEFCYNMQTQKRATLIGETTGGGANPGGGFPINDRLMVFVPTGRAINPITKINWEGVGVTPEIKISSEKALEKALEMAGKAAEEYRQKAGLVYKDLFNKLTQNIALHKSSASAEEANKYDEKIFESLKSCQQAGFFNEDAINFLGYSFLQKNDPKVAESIFKANTYLYPNSPNVYDSYGEALAANGKLKLSEINYQKAVDLAIEKKDQQLDAFKENLRKIKDRNK